MDGLRRPFTFMLHLPSDFISNIQNVFAEDGHAFLKALPDLIAQASARWGLTDVQPVSNLSFNFVAFANRPSTEDFEVGRENPAPTQNVVLKIGVRSDELLS